MWSKARTQFWRAGARGGGRGGGGAAGLGARRARRTRAAKVLPEEGGPWRMRKGNGPEGRRAASSQARQRIQAARSGRLRQARRAARAGPGAAWTGAGRDKVEREVWKRAFSPAATFQP